MMRKICKWLVDEVKRETPLSATRGTLREAVENLATLGINREDRRRFIERYNLKTISKEFLDFASRFAKYKIPSSEESTLVILYYLANANRNIPYSEDMEITLDDVPRLYDKIIKKPIITISL